MCTVSSTTSIIHQWASRRSSRHWNSIILRSSIQLRSSFTIHLTAINCEYRKMNASLLRSIKLKAVFPSRKKQSNRNFMIATGDCKSFLAEGRKQVCAAASHALRNQRKYLDLRRWPSSVLWLWETGLIKPTGREIGRRFDVQSALSDHHHHHLALGRFWVIFNNRQTFVFDPIWLLWILGFDGFFGVEMTGTET